MSSFVLGSLTSLSLVYRNTWKPTFRCFRAWVSSTSLTWSSTAAGATPTRPVCVSLPARETVSSTSPLFPAFPGLSAALCPASPDHPVRAQHGRPRRRFPVAVSLRDFVEFPLRSPSFHSFLFVLLASLSRFLLCFDLFLLLRFAFLRFCFSLRMCPFHHPYLHSELAFFHLQISFPARAVTT